MTRAEVEAATGAPVVFAVRRAQVVDIGDALDGVDDGARVMIGGWGNLATPFRLIEALRRRAPRDLTVIITGSGPTEPLTGAGLVSHFVTSFGTYAGRAGRESWFDRRVREDAMTVELCSQGMLAERIRAGGCRHPCVLRGGTAGRRVPLDRRGP